MSSLEVQDIRQQLSCELQIKDLEDGRMLDGDSEAPFSPPDDFDMAKFHRGRQFFRDHIFSCSISFLFSLVIGTSIPEFLEALVFTAQSDTPIKAYKRYAQTFYHVAMWHYGNIWEKESKAYKSIYKVRTIHKNIRENMQKMIDGSTTRKFISQYDMGVVMSGFMGAVIMYPEDGGIKCSLAELDDYVYFWYGVGHLLGIQKEYNICAYGLSQALTYCKSIEQNIVKKNMQKPPPEFKHVAETVITAFQGGAGFFSILTLPVISALFYELMTGDSDKLSLADTIRYLIWKLIFIGVKNVSWLRMYLNHKIESKSGLVFSEI